MPKILQFNDRDKAMYEIYCDFNAGISEEKYYLRRGTIDDLNKVNLTPELAVGMSFWFVADDIGLNGKSDDLMCRGSIEFDEEFGYIALVDGKIYHRSDKL